MLELTESAKKRLHQSLAEANRSDQRGKCFRLVPTSHPDFVTLSLAKPAPSDTTYKDDGVTVLAVPKALQPVGTRHLDIDAEGKLKLR